MTREQPNLRMSAIQAHYCHYAPKITSEDDHFYQVYNTNEDWLDGKDGKVQVVSHGIRKQRLNTHMKVNNDERTSKSVNVTSWKSKMSKQAT